LGKEADVPRQLRNARLNHLLIETHLQWSGTWRRLVENVGRVEAMAFLFNHKEFPCHADLVLDDGERVRGVG
jgi:hypothetical protein